MPSDDYLCPRCQHAISRSEAANLQECPFCHGMIVRENPELAHLRDNRPAAKSKWAAAGLICLALPMFLSLILMTIGKSLPSEVGVVALGSMVFVTIACCMVSATAACCYVRNPIAAVFLWLFLAVGLFCVNLFVAVFIGCSKTGSF